MDAVDHHVESQIVTSLGVGVLGCMAQNAHFILSTAPTMCAELCVAVITGFCRGNQPRHGRRISVGDEGIGRICHFFARNPDDHRTNHMCRVGVKVFTQRLGECVTVFTGGHFGKLSLTTFKCGLGGRFHFRLARFTSECVFAALSFRVK